MKFILECLDTFIKNSKRSRLNKERDVIINTSDGTKIEVRRIPTRKMLGILECLKESRFLEGYNEWIKLLYMIANGNNSLEVMNTYPDVQFVRVTYRPDYPMPEQWKYARNLRSLSYRDFVLEADI